MDSHEALKYSPKYCYHQRLRLTKLLLETPHKELARSYERRICDYRRQGALYGLLISGCGVFLTWTRFRGLKVHIPGILASVTLSMLVGAAFGVDLGVKHAIEEMGRIAEDKELDEMRTLIIQFCSRNVKRCELTS